MSAALIETKRVPSLVDPRHEWDSCGFGLLVQLDDRPSRWLVETAITGLQRLSHRGATAEDGKTGDGCGIYLRMPDPFFRQVAQEEFNTPLASMYAVGQIFLNQMPQKARQAMYQLTQHLHAEGLQIAFQRIVPIRMEWCGDAARQTLPQMVQIFINMPEGWTQDHFERRLYVARRGAELGVNGSDPDFYVASLSTYGVIYKGMVTPENLSRFYPDLEHPQMASSLCVFHQRFSTNTMPQWRLAQPFRMLAHNGEINTVQGNKRWALSRQQKMDSQVLPELKEFDPLIPLQGSDSLTMDGMLEVLVHGGMDFLAAARLLVPPAWQFHPEMDEDLRAFYEYYSLHMDPWDGPAGLVLTHGDIAACSLDRNGLRPARYTITEDHYLIVASETGIVDIPHSSIKAKGKVAPGEMLAVNLQEKTLWTSEQVDTHLKTRKPFAKWLQKKARFLNIDETLEAQLAEPPKAHSAQYYATLRMMQKLFLLTREERENILWTLGETGQELVSSMGDDTPIAVLSTEIRSFYDYFRQLFAQVTNPPIDPIRESKVMTLKTCFGREANPFDEGLEGASRLETPSPILSRSQYHQLINNTHPEYTHGILDITYDIDEELSSALERIESQALSMVRQGTVILILSDAVVSEKQGASRRLPIHALLATSAVHNALCREGIRCDSNLLVASATIRDPHHVATLIGFGATAVYPYFGYDMLQWMVARGQTASFCPTTVLKNYQHGLEKGLLKIMSKMGISTLNSYRSAQLFEALGLHHQLIDRYFPGTLSRIDGLTLTDLDLETRRLHQEAWQEALPIRLGGLQKFAPGEERHAYHPEVILGLQQAVRSGAYEQYKQFADTVNQRSPLALRDLLEFKPDRPSIPIEEVEAVSSIVRRFDTAAMSLGALSPEAHEALAIAMNRLGGRSNSGEGGEDPARFGTEKNSKIKQIASGRFGVTPAYLAHAEVLQIKMAQGAKPGEGGQLPGHKVNDLIARLRFTTPGTTLISPPPHHDIYSIEDLAQLIFDLKQANPNALVSVKLVSEPGVGTVAAGVAKTYADLITVAGHDGGTGASPISSVRYAGSPWELGLREAHETLRLHNLRHRITLQADGGFKTGLDVIKAALMGAESFGFGTAPMVVLGCKYLRICHLNTCATGLATQDVRLRQNHFKGLVQWVEQYFRFVAEEVREWLAYLGYRSLDEVIGQVHLLTPKAQLLNVCDKTRHINLETLLHSPSRHLSTPHRCTQDRNPPPDLGVLNQKIVRDALPLLEQGKGGTLAYTIRNTDRSVGATLSGFIALQRGNAGLSEDQALHISLSGVAGQSFGAWNIQGVNLTLEGDANDYVGKGMAGGILVLKPPSSAHYLPHLTPIMGNTCLYGATGGTLFASGTAGERFAVRNSGATAVIEGIGSHGCEYMTGGTVVVLGRAGINFGAGMTGGQGYVFDETPAFNDRCNPETISCYRIESLMESHPEIAFAHQKALISLLEAYVRETQSALGAKRLEALKAGTASFWLIQPKTAPLEAILSPPDTRQPVQAA